MKALIRIETDTPAFAERIAMLLINEASAEGRQVAASKTRKRFGRFEKKVAVGRAREESGNGGAYREESRNGGVNGDVQKEESGGARKGEAEDEESGTDRGNRQRENTRKWRKPREKEIARGGNRGGTPRAAKTN